ncbi:hypothetical protein FE257_000039 [Aspergillus nanangensis]|uniref:SRR1-like domain-containing protein n=1 Tax=Aspergillus nanangensis TaxID=2582783 RepID=A0AAD4GZJ6_ASPNN|nr:hypothetical protein FE257_000039 [Aspergillus nanangensis]
MAPVSLFLEWPSRPGQNPEDWAPKNTAEATANIDKWYDAGVPLFSRESLQEIQDRLQGPLKAGDMIKVKGMDGEVYQYKVKVGEKRSSYCMDIDPETGDGSETEQLVHYVMGLPIPKYTPIQHLKDNLTHGSLESAYCSLSIANRMHCLDQHENSLDRLEDSLELFNSSKRAWEQSDSWKQIQTTLSTVRLPTKIRKIVGMACGPFAIQSAYPGVPRSAVQHAFLLTLKKYLMENDMACDEIPCYAQDPAYTEADHRVLGTYDIEVVDDPRGFLELDHDSVLFCCAPNIAVKQVVTDIARPAILIWCKVEDADPDPEYRYTDPDSSRVRKMINEGYDEFPFPDDDNFTCMRIYVIRRGLGTEEVLNNGEDSGVIT